MEVGKAGMGSHHSARPQYDTWLTPLQIISVLGKFDLDPCAAPSPRPWPTAVRHIELPECGIEQPWAGRVFLNPPYGIWIGEWLEKMAMHGNGIALTFARTETAAWQRWVWPFAQALLFIDGRINFRLPDGTDPRKNAGAPSVLIAYTEFDAEVLGSCGISGFLVTSAHRVPAGCAT